MFLYHLSLPGVIMYRYLLNRIVVACTIQLATQKPHIKSFIKVLEQNI